MVGLLISFEAGNAGVEDDLAALLGVRAVESDDDRRPEVDSTQRFDDALRHFFTAGDAAEDVDEDALDLVVEVDDLERSGHHVGVGAAADVEEVRRRAPDLVDDVERAHREAGAVGDDADGAVEPDVLQALVASETLALVEHLHRPELLPLGMPERRVLVEAHLGVERMHLTGRLEDQRVDLGEVAIALGEAVVELHEDVGHTVERRRRDRGVDRRLPGDLGGQAVDRVDVELDDGVRVLLRHLFDLDATLGRQHQQVLLRRPVEREAGVVLLGDVGRVLDPDAVHDMALDVHAEDVAGMQPNLVGVVGELDPARLAPPADLHLGLDDDGVLGGIGCGHGLVDGVGGAAGGDRDAIAGEVLLALVLEQIHVNVSLTSVVLSVERLLEPLADALQRGARGEELGHALLLQRPHVGVGDDATAEHEHVAEIPAAQFVHHAREQREMRAREQREADGVDVFLQRRLGDLLGGLVQTGVDDLEAVIAQRPGDGLRAAVMAVQTRLGNDDSVWPLHERRTLGPADRPAPTGWDRSVGWPSRHGTLVSCNSPSSAHRWRGRWCPFSAAWRSSPCSAGSCTARPCTCRATPRTSAWAIRRSQSDASIASPTRSPPTARSSTPT